MDEKERKIKNLQDQIQKLKKEKEELKNNQ